MLEAKPAEGQTVTTADLLTAKTIVERRVNGLGVTEPLVQIQGENRIIVELPGIANPDQAVQTLKSTGQLEFVEIGSSTGSAFPNIQDGVYVRTTNNDSMPDKAELGATDLPYADQVFKTIMTGRELKDAQIQLDQYGAPYISFELTDAGAKIFGDYTAQHVGDTLAIVLDNVVLSAPNIRSAIPDGKGIIEGQFTREEADSLAVQMRYGALPVPAGGRQPPHHRRDARRRLRAAEHRRRHHRPVDGAVVHAGLLPTARTAGGAGVAVVRRSEPGAV